MSQSNVVFQRLQEEYLPIPEYPECWANRSGSISINDYNWLEPYSEANFYLMSDYPEIYHLRKNGVNVHLHERPLMTVWAGSGWDNIVIEFDRQRTDGYVLIKGTGTWHLQTFIPFSDFCEIFWKRDGWPEEDCNGVLHIH